MAFPQLRITTFPNTKPQMREAESACLELNYQPGVCIPFQFLWPFGALSQVWSPRCAGSRKPSGERGGPYPAFAKAEINGRTPTARRALTAIVPLLPAGL